PESKGGWGIKKFNLDELYVRFFRIAERRIVKGGRGIVSYISSFSYLDKPSFVVMRQRFLDEFDEFWFDCMNGDSRETGKKTPDGKPDPSVFSTEQNKQGIKVGTTISLLVRKKDRHKKPQVRFRHFWGIEKRKELLDSLKAKNINGKYKISKPEKSNRYSFRPSNVAEHYLDWPIFLELSSDDKFQGMDEDRANALIDIDKKKLAERIQIYFDKDVSWESFSELQTGLSRKSAGFDPKKMRHKVQSKEQFDRKYLCKYLFRPSDIRWCYYCDIPNLWKRRRPELWDQAREENSFILSRAAGVANPEGVPFIFTRNLFARDCMRGHAVAFPVRLYQANKSKSKKNSTPTMFNDDESVNNITANLSKSARGYLKSIGIS
ncbi:unnamed protein product, partial [marine sediment metagenome]